MNLQFLSGNPKRGKSRKKLAKRKKGSNLKSMRKTKKNPITVTRVKNGREKVIAQFLTPREKAAISKAARKQAKKLKPSSAKKFMSIQAKRLHKNLKSEARAKKYVSKAAALNRRLLQAGKSGIKLGGTHRDDIAGALKKMKLSKYGRPSKATAWKHINASQKKAEKSASKTSKAAKAAHKKAIRERVMKNLNIKDEEALKKRLSSLRKKKGSSVAKKRKKKHVKRKAVKRKHAKRKHTKRKHTKKKHSKRKHTKRKHTKRKHTKKRVRKSAKRRSSKRRSSKRRSTKRGRYISKAKSVTVYRTRKGGKALKTKTLRKPRGGKLSAFIKNPFGGAMKGLDKVNAYLEKGIGHSAQEAGTLLVAGGMVGAVEGLVIKGISTLKLPIPAAIAKYVPTIGTLAAAGAAHYFAEKQLGKNHVATQLAKAVIAASIVKAGDQFLGGIVKSTLGMSGVIATYGEVPMLSAPMGYHSPADFGEIPRVVPGMGYHSPADFGTIPRVVPGMGDVLAVPNTGVSGIGGVIATPMGYHSPADFGGQDSEHGDVDYENSDSESMC
jgi:hypothetical protein